MAFLSDVLRALYTLILILTASLSSMFYYVCVTDEEIEAQHSQSGQHTAP